MGIGEMFVSHEQAQTCGPIRKLASASGVESEEKLWFKETLADFSEYHSFYDEYIQVTDLDSDVSTSSEKL